MGTALSAWVPSVPTRPPGVRAELTLPGHVGKTPRPVADVVRLHWSDELRVPGHDAVLAPWRDAALGTHPHAQGLKLLAAEPLARLL